MRKEDGAREEPGLKEKLSPPCSNCTPVGSVLWTEGLPD